MLDLETLLSKPAGVRWHGLGICEALIVVGGAFGFGALQLNKQGISLYFVPASPSQVHHEGPPLQAGYRERAGLPEVQVCWVPERHWTQ